MFSHPAANRRRTDSRRQPLRVKKNIRDYNFLKLNSHVRHYHRLRAFVARPHLLSARRAGTTPFDCVYPVVFRLNYSGLWLRRRQSRAHQSRDARRCRFRARWRSGRAFHGRPDLARIAQRQPQFSPARLNRDVSDVRHLRDFHRAFGEPLHQNAPGVGSD